MQVAVTGGPHDSDPLALDPETMRELGYRTIDLLVERLQREEPPIRRASPAEMRERLHGPPPDQPQPFDEILAGLDRDVLPFASRDGHPRFFGFVPFAGTWPGALGDLIASACNLYAGSWMESAGPSQVELEVLGWFKDWIGFPPEAAGSLVSGGSAGNLTALACARETLAGPMRDDLVLYVSDQAHSSVARAARILGFRPEQVRVLPSDESFRLAPRTLRGRDGGGRAARPDAVRRRGAGRERPTPARSTRSTSSPRSAASAGPGCTWTRPTAVSPRSPTAACCPGSSRPTRSRSTRTSGSTSRSSAAACSSATGRRCARAFEMLPDYLHDARTAEGEVNFSDLGLQLTRSARALKLWVSLRYFGARRLPRRDPAHARARGQRGPAHRVERDAGADGAARRSASSASAGATSTTRATRGSRPRWSGAAPAWSRRRGCTAASRCGCAC